MRRFATEFRQLPRRRQLLTLALCICLLHTLRVLLVELPGTPVVRNWIARRPSAARVDRDRAIATLREIAPEGNVFLHFTLPPAQRHLAEFFTYNWTLDMYPRTVFVSEQARIINNARDILRQQTAPTQQWLLAHDVTRTCRVWTDEQSRINMNVDAPGGASP